MLNSRCKNCSKKSIPLSSALAYSARGEMICSNCGAISKSPKWISFLYLVAEGVLYFIASILSLSYGNVILLILMFGFSFFMRGIILPFFSKPTARLSSIKRL